MINVGFKGLIINKLNELFLYTNISILCNYFGNDVNKVVQILNKIFKYVFVNPDFALKQDFFNVISLIEQTLACRDLDYKYRKYIDKKHKIFKGIYSKTLIDFPFDQDIYQKDLINLRVPSYNELQKICEDNKKIKTRRVELKFLLEKKYKEEKNAIEPAFTYTRTELIDINRGFMYYHPQLTGDVDTDFYLLYNDDRKANQLFLGTNHYDNLERIKSSKDFEFIKVGNMYEIINGRHRLLYALKNRNSIQIKAIVRRRVEDKKVNDLLIELKKEYAIKVFKNNILNDDIDILIIYQGITYNIKNKYELINFAYDLKNNCDLSKYVIAPYIFLPSYMFDELILDYKWVLYKIYKEENQYIFLQNYSDFIKAVPYLNNNVFYTAFTYLQELYNRSILYEFDFDELFEKIADIHVKQRK